MSITQFSRDSMARWYAKQYLKTDPGIVAVYFLPKNAGEREIRFIIINKLIPELLDEALEPIDFGIDRDTDTEHQLLFLDITPKQWERIEAGEVSLPTGWSIDDAFRYPE